MQLDDRNACFTRPDKASSKSDAYRTACNKRQLVDLYAVSRKQYMAHLLLQDRSREIFASITSLFIFSLKSRWP